MPSDNYTMHVRIDPDVREQIHAAATAERRSLTNMLHVLILEALAAREAKAAQK
jgi:predicted HicB family RNase H-like nuclease